MDESADVIVISVARICEVVQLVVLLEVLCLGLGEIPHNHQRSGGGTDAEFNATISSNTQATG